MMLDAILKGCELAAGAATVLGTLGQTGIRSVTCDSRQATGDSLFIAVRGHAADGHDFIAQAFEQGAAAVVAQQVPAAVDPAWQDRIILVRDSRKATALAACNFYGHPSETLTLIGITGTNGKTTTSWILEEIFKTCGYRTGVIGTVNIRYGDKVLDNPTTTPDAVSLQETLHRMKADGVTHVLMEVSSHSLDQHRVLGCRFNAGIFTNLTQDHLDYHRSLDDYFQCKKRLFADYLAPCAGTAVINTADAYGRRLADTTDCPVIRVGIEQDADISATNVKEDISGLAADLAFNGRRMAVSSALTGRFNLENILCAAGAALAVGVDPESAIQGISSIRRVPGRLERLDTPLNRHIFVDYAHTPDALASILGTLSKTVPSRLITVFGCGGDRDRTKRGPMGTIACKGSDIAIVTSDNPRSESPEAILEDILTGIRAAGFRELDPGTLAPGSLAPGQKGYIVEVDREKALELAVNISGPGDTIVAAGKGHETYQITNSGTIHFDDMEKLSAACARLTTPMDWSIEDLSRALETSPLTEPEDSTMRFTAIGTDSRTIEPDMVFVALEGENFDGHDFIPALADRGIRSFVVRRGFIAALSPEIRDGLTAGQNLIFETGNTLTALGCLARFHRSRANVKLVAITGSNGKTTTRKMAREIFAGQYDVLATQGNFNNEIGVPLTLFRLAPVHQWAVIEMGMNHPGEISRLSAIARPDIALITNTSGAHLEGLKTPENVARAKSEIFESMSPGSTALIFSDDPRRDIMASAAESSPHISRVLTFGAREDADLRAVSVEDSDHGIRFSVRYGTQTESFAINTPARFMVNNALAAMGAARAAGIGTDVIRAGLAAFTPVKGRMNLGRLSGGTRLIDDTYNANPASMTQALKTLCRIAGKNRAVAALGDMLELGPDSDRLHREIGHLIADLAPQNLYLFGTQTRHIKDGALEKGYPADRIFAGSKDEIAEQMAPLLTADAWLLLKGSRGMAMETLIPKLNAEIERIDRKMTEEKAD